VSFLSNYEIAKRHRILNTTAEAKMIVKEYSN
jgi:hypothetical protein